MKKLTIVAFMIFVFHNAVGQDLKPEYQKFIKSFIENVKKDKKEAVAAVVKYPLKRESPILPINTKAEFVKRYNEIFDTALKNEIIKSNPAKDWSQVGWRGIMLNQGTVWMDEDGKLIAINYQSKFELDKKNKIIAADKTKLHSSISIFKEPVCILETSKFRVRIDHLGNGNYRYASWFVKKAMSEKPDLIITKGKWIADGSGGNHHYDFKKGQYLYECYIAVLRETNAAPATLTIYQNENEILSQDARLISE